MNWPAFWFVFKVLLAVLCVGGFFFPWMVQVIGGVILAWIVFGPSRKHRG